VQEAITWWLKEGSVYGFAVVFMAATLFGVLWVAYQAVILLKFWIPKVAEAHLELIAKLSKSLDDFSAGLTLIAGDGEASRAGLHGLLMALLKQLGDKSRNQKLGIESDAVFHIQQAERSMRRFGANPTKRKKNDDGTETTP
jgi:hypothetical protein